MANKAIILLVLLFITTSCNRKLVVKNENYIDITFGYILQQGDYRWFLPYADEFSNNAEIIKIINNHQLYSIGLRPIYIPNKFESDSYTTLYVGLPNETKEDLLLEIYACTLYTFGPLKSDTRKSESPFVYDGKEFIINYYKGLSTIFYKLENR
ncbi:MAG: hypothetical protein IPI65_22175 [Bacteroidetes bacterium]|nr:hypothetical protein [Bacteroidota bacterium]